MNADTILLRSLTDKQLRAYATRRSKATGKSYDAVLRAAKTLAKLGCSIPSSHITFAAGSISALLSVGR